MNRDALLATVIGFILGLAITTAILLWPQAAKYFAGFTLSMPQSAAKTAKPTTAPTDTSPEPQSEQEPLTVVAPITESIASSDEILVSGTAISGSTVTIAGPNDETAVPVGTDGKYAGKVTLSEGINTILVSTLSEGKITDKTIRIFFTEEKLQ